MTKKMWRILLLCFFVVELNYGIYAQDSKVILGEPNFLDFPCKACISNYPKGEYPDNVNFDPHFLCKILVAPDSNIISVECYPLTHWNSRYSADDSIWIRTQRCIETNLKTYKVAPHYWKKGELSMNRRQISRMNKNYLTRPNGGFQQIVFYAYFYSYDNDTKCGGRILSWTRIKPY